MSQQWGFIAERLFVDDAEALSPPTRDNILSIWRRGYKYTDVNRDGKITNADAVPIGLHTPEIVYGFGTSVGYKGFDFSLFFQGLTNESFGLTHHTHHLLLITRNC